MSIVKSLAYTDNDGDLVFYDVSLFLDQIKQKPNKHFEISAKEIGIATTDAQRGYYFAVINKLIYYRLLELGYEISETQTHKWKCKHSNVLKEVITVVSENGNLEQEEIQIEFHKANKTQISEYIEETIRFASNDLGVSIPPPPTTGEVIHRITSPKDLEKYRIASCNSK